MQTDLFASRPVATGPAPGPMTALSLLQPWAWAVLEAGKRLENRSRRDGERPPMMLYRGVLWLHASKTEARWYWEQSVGDMISAGVARPYGLSSGSSGPSVPPRGLMARGCIVGRCRVVGYVSPLYVPKTARNGRARMEMWKHFGGDARRPNPAAQRCDPDWERQQWLWWGGGYAMILADVEKLTRPIPCKGAQGLWQIPGDVAAQLAGAELLPCAA